MELESSSAEATQELKRAQTLHLMVGGAHEQQLTPVKDLNACFVSIVLVLGAAKKCAAGMSAAKEVVFFLYFHFRKWDSRGLRALRP